MNCKVKIGAIARQRPYAIVTFDFVDDDNNRILNAGSIGPC